MIVIGESVYAGGFGDSSERETLRSRWSSDQGTLGPGPGLLVCAHQDSRPSITNRKRVSLHPVHVLACVLLLQILREASINVFDNTGKTDGTNN
jgi:hypothetical protein